jgi:CxxC motif-containing protein (DUF1111 family)
MRLLLWMVGTGAAMAACVSTSAEKPAPVEPDASAEAPAAFDTFDVPIAAATADERLTFSAGDRLFELSLREADGLGPLYTRASCASCHASGVRGPGTVEKMAVVLADGFTTSPDQSVLPFGSSARPFLTAGAKTPIEPPTGNANVKVTERVGPSILGRGYIEAILDSEIERVAAEQSARADAIVGRVNRVVYTSERVDTAFHQHRKGDTVIGRFGFKARIATLDDFTADALQNDMGITSPERPNESPNPDGLTDDAKPGVDVTADSVELRAMYVRLTAIPSRASATDEGRTIFERIGCSACHVPSMKTRSDYPIASLAGIDAPIYSDLLVHDMGPALADGISEGIAQSRDWRTAPLIGLRHNKVYLHDGRSRTVEDAIIVHGGEGSEAADAVKQFSGLPADERAKLLAFVNAL